MKVRIDINDGVNIFVTDDVAEIIIKRMVSHITKITETRIIRDEKMQWMVSDK